MMLVVIRLNVCGLLQCSNKNLPLWPLRDGTARDAVDVEECIYDSKSTGCYVVKDQSTLNIAASKVPTVQTNKSHCGCPSSSVGWEGRWGDFILDGGR